MKITKKTYDKNVEKFAKKYKLNFIDMENLFNKLGFTDNERDKIYTLIDKRVDIVNEQIDYCLKNEIDEYKFIDDILNNKHF